MKTRLTALLAAGLLGSTLALTGCGSDGGDNGEDTGHDAHSDHGQTDAATDAGGASEAPDDAHAHMEHPADGGPPPEGIAEAEDPTHTVGSEVTLTADHMPGMDGATATIVGAFDTYTYSVSYTPTDGGEPVEDHKWVVQEELDQDGAVPDERLEDGATATINAEHMAGMDGAEATIDSSTDETVYMVDVEADGMDMTNHKWVTESEIS
ncbi:MAG: YdhK family protein [Mycobacteriaceae bacterium]|uniref:YdhK family protein n=1 Tax=Corynebacterium sp. TaxID=1720 RepID=UPI003F9AD45E